MDGQYLRERIDNPEILGRTDQNINSPVPNFDLYANKTPLDTVLPPETPLIETLAPVAPVDNNVIQIAPQNERITEVSPSSVNAETLTALLSHEESERFRTRWNEIQGKFVDEPQSAVQEADALVSEVINQITQMFDNNHSSLEQQWKQGNNVSTEDLRKALQHYRSFFNRLVV
jgi:hypothetical protein